jgi:ABC-type transport system involved in cytochrome bd biosynthesis fused ATPase/permease subunit
MTTTSNRRDALPVRVVAANPIAEHRARETRLITGVIAAVCAVANACAVIPAVDDLVTALVLAALVTVLAVVVLRWVVRRVRWWFEDRADARTAAAWRARQDTPRDDVVRAGVA